MGRPALDEHRAVPIVILGVRYALGASDFDSGEALSALGIGERPGIGGDGF